MLMTCGYRMHSCHAKNAMVTRLRELIANTLSWFEKVTVNHEYFHVVVLLLPLFFVHDLLRTLYQTNYTSVVGGRVHKVLRTISIWLYELSLAIICSVMLGIVNE